jgi:RecA-family ATPase
MVCNGVFSSEVEVDVEARDEQKPRVMLIVAKKKSQPWTFVSASRL